jgi:aspartate/methionine/tyrosine aminotransferase
MFSRRVPGRLEPNRVSVTLARLRAARRAIVDLTESNPTKVGLDYPADLLQPLAHPRGLSYEPQPFGLDSAREAVAADFERRGISVDPARIALTASTSEAYSLLFKLFCNPGDEILVPVPSYPLFDHLSAFEGVVAIPYLLDYHGAWRIDRADLEARLSPRTRAVLVVQPNNPTGSVLDAGELAWLGRLCAERDVALVGDEVFADYPLDPLGAGARSVLTLEPRAESRAPLVCSLGGLSKSAGLPQLKLGWIALDGPAATVADATSRLELICDTYLSVSTPVQAAAGALLAAGGAIRQQIQTRVLTNYRTLRSTALDYPACRVLRAEGGWSAVVQVPATQPEEALVLRLVEESGVLVHPGYFFDFPGEAFLVMSLLPPPDRFGPAIVAIFDQAEKGS